MRELRDEMDELRAETQSAVNQLNRRIKMLTGAMGYMMAIIKNAHPNNTAHVLNALSKTDPAGPWKELLAILKDEA